MDFVSFTDSMGGTALALAAASANTKRSVKKNHAPPKTNSSIFISGTFLFVPEGTCLFVSRKNPAVKTISTAPSEGSTTVNVSAD